MEEMILVKTVFLDASYIIALAAPGDQYHQRAKILANELEEDQASIITTQAVILEIGNALAKLRYRAAAIMLIESLNDDPDIEIVPIKQDLFERAFELFRTRLDKEWGLTDCISFIVMKDRDINDVLTTDSHFSQAGFNVLL